MNIVEKHYDWGFALTPRSLTTHLILHHTASESASAESIHAYHKSLGWAGIAYHYLVRKDGTVYRGRPEDMRGGHTANWNYCSIGICFEGNFELEEMPQAQFDAGRELIADIASRYTSIEIGRHCEYGSTACPGKSFPFDALVGARLESGDAERTGEPDAWAKSACDRAVEQGIFLGDGNGEFDWHRAPTRQELAVLLERCFEKMSK